MLCIAYVVCDVYITLFQVRSFLLNKTLYLKGDSFHALNN